MEKEKCIQYVPLNSSVTTLFWDAFTRLKLNKLHLNTDPVLLTGSYSRRAIEGIPPLLQLDHESFLESSSTENVSALRGQLSVPGTLINTNTIKDFKNEDKTELLKKMTEKIWDAIVSGKAEQDPSLLGSFIVYLFADLKKYHYYYWFAFPAFTYPKSTRLISDPQSLTQYIKDKSMIQNLLGAIQRCSFNTAYFVAVVYNGEFTILPLTHYVECKAQAKEGEEVLLCFSDPCSVDGLPGWPLRNLLTLASVRWSQIHEHCVLALREEVRHGITSLDKSLIFEIKMESEAVPASIPDVVGWERNERGKFGPKFVNARNDMEPEKVAESAVELNLKLMRWRLVPDLDLEVIRSCKCLLFGTGTLGCNVARGLLGWGVQTISFVDCGTVSYSNPVRQSLFNFEDCLGNGKPKALCAAEALKRIYPKVEATGYDLTIPMPGHTVGPNQKSQMMDDLRSLEQLVESHDAIFLLTDSRESRWVPSLLGAVKQKIVITTALGFDSFLVMRHGIPSDDQVSVPGCYYCNDVVAPGNSMSDRTLDQQCTVTRPGVSLMASGQAVELLIGLLQHPMKGRASCQFCLEDSSSAEESILGLVPHSIRYYLGRMHQLTTANSSFKNCSACGPSVREAFLKEGLEFVFKAINSSSYLEQVSGLGILQESSLSAQDIDEESTVLYLGVVKADN